MDYLDEATSHASHEACELKSTAEGIIFTRSCHASHEACELKYGNNANKIVVKLSRLA